jgi:argininosuccinate lyase
MSTARAKKRSSASSKSAKAPVKNWESRLASGPAQATVDYVQSLSVDARLYKQDIAGSIAHAQMLAEVRLISRKDLRRIRSGLKAIGRRIEAGRFHFDPAQEDIHMAVEAALIELAGDAGRKLHTARSRNDQVALDVRLYLRTSIKEIMKLLVNLQRVLLYKSEKHFALVMPGYTHTQRAQPVLLSHHLLAYVSMLERDFERLNDCLGRVNKSPLGAAAFAGTTFPIDRHAVAKKLHFDGIIENSIDAVSDRDFAIEFVSACSILMMHLSRFAEELVLWSTAEFGFVRMSDAYTTGSSIMPQKKNPDMAELVRGKTGRVYGALVNLLTIMKGLPLAYNRDMQEDKAPLFDVVQTTRQSLFIFAHILVHTTFDKERLAETLRTDFLTATDMADYLVRKGLPFRQAHEVSGKVVAYCVSHKMFFGNLDLDTLTQFSDLFESDVFDYILPLSSVQHKQSAGSTAPHEVKKQVIHWTRVLKNRKIH